MINGPIHYSCSTDHRDEVHWIALNDDFFSRSLWYRTTYSRLSLQEHRQKETSTLRPCARQSLSKHRSIEAFRSLHCLPELVALTSGSFWKLWQGTSWHNLGTMQCAQHCCCSNEPEEIGNIERSPDPLEDEEINAAITGLTCARLRNLIKRIKHIWRAVFFFQAHLSSWFMHKKCIHDISLLYSLLSTVYGFLWHIHIVMCLTWRIPGFSQTSILDLLLTLRLTMCAYWDRPTISWGPWQMPQIDTYSIVNGFSNCREPNLVMVNSMGARTKRMRPMSLGSSVRTKMHSMLDQVWKCARKACVRFIATSLRVWILTQPWQEESPWGDRCGLDHGYIPRLIGKSNFFGKMQRKWNCLTPSSLTFGVPVGEWNSRLWSFNLAGSLCWLPGPLWLRWFSSFAFLMCSPWTGVMTQRLWVTLCSVNSGHG